MENQHRKIKGYRELSQKVTRRVWVYDEETVVEIDRVNIGVTECT